MRFHICLGNHYYPEAPPGASMIMLSVWEDGVRFLRCALEEAGHEVTISGDTPDPDAINLIWERFFNFSNGNDDPEMFQRRGYRYAIICTEPLASWGLYNAFEYDETSARVLWDRFAYTARRAEFVWHVLEEAGPNCRKLNPNSHFLPLGFTPAFPQLSDPAKRCHLIDFIFQGGRSSRRDRMGERLAAHGYTVSISAYWPNYIRLGMLETARISLSIQRSDQHSIFSVGRIHHAIMNRVPIVVEYDGPPTYLSRYCTVVASRDFVDMCVEMAKRTDLQDMAQTTYDRFAAEMPMRPMMEEIMLRTFGRSP